jgi:BMFP domain-containing protein YqiC
VTQIRNPFFDELAKIMTNAAGAAQGVSQEIEALFRSQGEKMLNDMDLVKREEFEAVKEMAAKAREENDKLAERIAELEEQLKSKD